MSQAIGYVPASVTLNSCLNGNLAVCSNIVRDPGTGGFASPNGYVKALSVNTGYQKTAGVDFEANYATDLNDWGVGNYGALAINFMGTYLDYFNVQPYTGANSSGATYYDCAGLYGLTCGTPNPTWRHKLRITWSTPWDVSFSVNWRHYGGTGFDGNSSNPFLSLGYQISNAGAGGNIPAYNYFDLATSWAISDGVKLDVGVNNVMDKDPPLLAAGGAGPNGTTVGSTGGFNGNTYRASTTRWAATSLPASR